MDCVTSLCNRKQYVSTREDTYNQHCDSLNMQKYIVVNCRCLNLLQTDLTQQKYFMTLPKSGVEFHHPL